MDKDTYDQYRMQNFMQDKAISAQGSRTAPQLFEEVQQNQAVLVAQTDPYKVVKEVIMRLRGLDYDNNGNLIQIYEPKLNGLGIEKMSFWLSSYINDGARLSHLDRGEINKIMRELGDDLPLELGLNWKLYGIKHKTDLDSINNCILSNIFFVLKRAEEQNEKNWLGRISVENISNTSNLPNMKKEGFLSKFKL